MVKKANRHFKHARSETEPMFSQRLNRNASRWVVEVNSEVLQDCGESQVGEDELHTTLIQYAAERGRLGDALLNLFLEAI